MLLRPTLPTVDPLDDLRRSITQHGWAVRCVIDENPALCLAYTIGLTRHDHPEMVITGLPRDVGAAFLNLAGKIIVEDGGRFPAGTDTTALADGRPLPVIEVIDKSDLTAVEALYGDVPAVQVIWTDSAGNLPWEEDYANPPGTQPLLGSRP